MFDLFVLLSSSRKVFDGKPQSIEISEIESIFNIEGFTSQAFKSQSFRIIRKLDDEWLKEIHGKT